MMRRILLLFATVATLVLLWAGAWFYASTLIRGQVGALAAADGVSSPRLTCGALDVSGFPFRFDVTCAQAALALADTTVALPELRATVLVYRPTHGLLFAQGPARISDAFTGSQQQLQWTALEASIRLNGWRLARASLHAENLALSDILAGETLLAKADLYEAHVLDMEDADDPATALQSVATVHQAEGFSAPGLQIADGTGWLEGEISSLPDDIRLLLAPELLRRWQQAGGVFRLVSLDAQANDLSLQASGEGQLSEAGLVNGTVDLRSVGFAERIGAFLPPQLQPVIFGVPGDDGAQQTTLTIREGVVLAGFIPVTMLPALF